jgi:tripartite-type tricarboxylate transporter receptor subunit TctC
VFLVCTMGTHALQPAIGRAGYDPVADFAPVALLMAAPMVAAAAPSAGIASLDALRQETRRLRFSSSAIGGGPHLAGLLFARETGLDLSHTLYSDTRQLYADLEAGLVELSFNNLASMAPRVASGKLVGLAVTGTERVSELPNLPTMAESGLAGTTITNWVGLAAPRGTDAGLCAAVAAALGSDPAAFAAHLAAERTRWRDVGALLANAA